ncbi:CE1759 family FMN reductase [Corynebacterium sp. H127]|uniref:CE1759 family FMN reductase n=1 Tax=Corynebacterium sp. H127 TaxID=3133418 RepID=UPI0030A222CA
MHKLVVLSAGLSSPSATRNLAEQISGAVTTAISARGESAALQHIELRDLAVELAQSLTSPGFTPTQLLAAQESVADSDALIAVTPIFSASYSGLFKTFFDLLDKDALQHKPVLLAATAGTPRHSLALEHAMRPLFSYLRARTMPTAIFAATEDFGGSEHLGSRIAQGARELADTVVLTSGSVGGLGGPSSVAGNASDIPAGSFADFLSRYN